MDPLLKIEHLEKKYGTFKAVDNISFEIRQNEIFGLLGPNGAGKTTTISMLCGLLPPTSGSVSIPQFDGINPKKLIGYCPQENIYYPKLTCLEQLHFIGRMYGIKANEVNKRSIELLSLLGIADKTNTYAHKLSGGMKRRLNICLALVHDPEILILDEPEAGLDPQSRLLVRDFIAGFGQRKTVLLTTHNMDEADRLANRIAIMDHGKILITDTPENLKLTVGKGDLLELAFEKPEDLDKQTFDNLLVQNNFGYKWNDNTIMITQQNIVEQIAFLKTLTEKSHLMLTEIKLRQNTLEDVFIHLTGRSLRQ